MSCECLRCLKEGVAKGLCVTRDERLNLYVARENYLKRNVIREYLNAGDIAPVIWLDVVHKLMFIKIL